MSGKVGILIHGCHLEAEDWQRIVFGDEHHLGRVPTGIIEAFKHNAELIFWGTGASWKLTNKGKMHESEYTYHRTLGSELHQVAEKVQRSAEEIAAYVKKVSVIDTKTQNTNEEIKAALDECIKRKIDSLILVSSPTHIARCLQTACIVQEQAKHKLPITIYATFSETCFYKTKAENVKIIEPPHRGDHPKPPVPIYKIIGKMFKISRRIETFRLYVFDWDQLTNKYIKLEELQANTTIASMRATKSSSNIHRVFKMKLSSSAQKVLGKRRSAKFVKSRTDETIMPLLGQTTTIPDRNDPMRNRFSTASSPFLASISSTNQGNRGPVLKTSQSFS